MRPFTRRPRQRSKMVRGLTSRPMSKFSDAYQTTTEDRSGQQDRDRSQTGQLPPPPESKLNKLDWAPR